MQDQFKKIQSLINQTGDRAIVVDTDGTPLYVLMPFREFEKMILDKTDVKGLSEEEFLEKINRDIAVWRSSQEDETVEDWEINLGGRKDREMAENREKIDIFEPEKPTEKEELEQDETYYFEPID